MADPAVLLQLRELVGLAMVPGTLNVRLRQPLERGSEWQYLPAEEIAPDWQARTGQAGYFHVPCSLRAATAVSRSRPRSLEGPAIRPT